MANLDTQPYKGTRDFYPNDMRLERYIFDVWRKVVEQYGYEEYNGPMLEMTDLYRAKTGEEIVNDQIYSFEDRGGRDVTIRPEMTPTLARMVAARQQELVLPLRWYSIPNLWRYERPQKGRLREHWQLNVDIFGLDSVDAEYELIKIARAIMSEFGAKDDMYIFKVNSRKLMSIMMGDYLELDIDTSHRLYKLLDRKPKIENKAFVNQAAVLLGDKLEKFLAVVNVKKIAELPEELSQSDAVKELAALGTKLAKSGVKNIEFDMSIVRGFDYYTGIVFEVLDTHPENNRSIFGGGRYDDLLGIFKAEKIPTAGFGMGDASFREFLVLHDLLPKLQQPADVYITSLDRKLLNEVNNLADQLRAEGVKVAVDYSGRKLGLQIKTADKKHIPWVIVVGEEEIKTQKYTLRNMSKGEEQKLSVSEIIQKLSD